MTKRNDGAMQPRDTGDQAPLPTWPVKVSELEEESHGLVSRGGYVRFDAGSTKLLRQIGQAHGMEGYYPHIEVRESKESEDCFLVPTVESNPDKLPVRWHVTRRTCSVPMRKVLKLKKTRIPAKHNLEVPCSITTIDQGAAVAFRITEGTVKPVAVRGDKGGSTPAGGPA